MDRLDTGHKLSTCYAHDEDVRPFESVNKCATCSTEHKFSNLFWFNFLEAWEIESTTTWLKEMIECKDCNRRFCKKCQEDGTLDGYLHSSNCACFDFCDVCLKIDLLHKGSKDCKVCERRVCEECDENGSHDDRCHKIT